MSNAPKRGAPCASPSLAEAKRMLRAARVRSGASLDDVAAAMGRSEQLVRAMLVDEDPRYHVRFGDLLACARDPRTVTFALEAIAELATECDQMRLTVANLQDMASTARGQELARAALRSTAEKLWPVIGNDTNGRKVGGE